MPELRRWRAFLREQRITLPVALLYCGLVAVIAFLLGGLRPESDYRKLEKKLEENHADMRLFADEMARRNGLLNTLQARQSLQKKTIELLNKRVSELMASNLREREKLALYQQILGKSANNDFVIYALSAAPDFNQEFWLLSATLVRAGNKKTFSGGYFFEIVTGDAEGKRAIRRHPDAGHIDLKMQVSYDIEESVELPLAQQLDNIRLVVLDSKGEIAATAELADYEEDAPAQTPYDAAPLLNP